MKRTNVHDAFVIEPVESRTLLFGDAGMFAPAFEPLPPALPGMFVHAMKLDYAPGAAPRQADAFGAFVFAATTQAFTVDGRQLMSTVFSVTFTFPVAEVLPRPVEGFGDGAARGAPRARPGDGRDAVAPPAAKVMNVAPAPAALRGSAIPEVVRPTRQPVRDGSAAGSTSEMIVTRAARRTIAPTNAAAGAVRGNWAGRSVMLYLSQLTEAVQPPVARLAADAQAPAAGAASRAEGPARGIRVDTGAETPSSDAPAQRFEILPLGSPLALLADSIGAFVEEAARISSLPAGGPHRAWMVTLTVLAADAAILTYYYYRKRNDARLVRVRSRCFIP